jgi:hypothetical protein
MVANLYWYSPFIFEFGSSAKKYATHSLNDIINEKQFSKQTSKTLQRTSNTRISLGSQEGNKKTPGETIIRGSCFNHGYLDPGLNFPSR